jgi:RNA polymerase sigma-70 factor (ECF subfamily)
MMPRDIGQYHTQITQFVDELCRVYYKHSQPEDRRDINSEIALIAHQNREQVTDESETAFLAWLREIAKNVIRNWSRRQGTVARHALGSLDDENFGDVQIPSDSPTPETHVLLQEQLEVVRDAILELPPIHQQVVWLFYIEELSEKQIAKQLDIQRGTVKSRLHHARRQLATRLAPYFFQ